MSTVKNAPADTKTDNKDAIALLVADHKEVKGMFDDFKSAPDGKKADLVARICKALKVHMAIEEEIFYPAVQKALQDHDMVPEGLVEHGSVKDLIAAVEGVKPGGDDYDARVKVMGEFIEHHVKDEETEMFPKAKKSTLDLVALGQKMSARKQELMAGK